MAFLQESLGLTMIVNPDLAAATEISRILRRRSVLDINPFSKGRVELLKIKIEKDSPLSGLPLYELSRKLRCDVLICVVERGTQVIIPDGHCVLESGDIISFLASPQNASLFLKKAGLPVRGVNNCMIVGGSKGAYYLAGQLINHGIAVKIIEKNRQRCEELSVLLPKAMIINGDGTDQSLLLEEGLEYMDSFVTMTDLDEENILLSLYAHTKSSAKIVTKVNHFNFDGVIESLDIGTTIYPKNTTAEYVIRYVRAMQNSLGSNVETLYRIIEDKVEALEFTIREQSAVTDIPFEELGKANRLRDNILIGCIIRQEKIIIPRGSDQILVGDTVVIISGIPGLTDIIDILK
jgi:trk system potassium uptake protein TrkA